MSDEAEAEEALKCADASVNWKLANLKRCADALMPLARALRSAWAERDAMREENERMRELVRKSLGGNCCEERRRHSIGHTMTCPLFDFATTLIPAEGAKPCAECGGTNKDSSPRV